MSVLSFSRVTVRYEPEGPAVLHDLNLEVQDGERIALLGLNGSGKTTLLKAAVGLLPHSGRIEVCGEPLGHRTLTRIRSQVGFLFNQPEDQLLFPRVLDDVAFGPRHAGASREAAHERAMEALTVLGIAHLADTDIHRISHGQRQRVALAGLLASAPRLLLLDEPSAALDPPARHRLAELLANLPAAIVIATHDLEFARKCCTRAVSVSQGQVESCGLRPSDTLWLEALEAP